MASKRGTGGKKVPKKPPVTRGHAGTRRVSRSKGVPTWREVVQKALDKLGKSKSEITLAEVYAEVKRQDLRKRGPNWQPKVRQTLQLLWKSQSPSIIHPQPSDPAKPGRIPSKRGVYHVPKQAIHGLPNQTVMDMLIEGCQSAGYEIEHSQYWAHDSFFLQPFPEHTYQVDFAVGELDELVDEEVENLSEAAIMAFERVTVALGEWYHKTTAVMMRVAHLSPDGEPYVEWATIAYSDTPRVAGMQLAFAIQEMFDKYADSEKYKLVRIVVGMSWTMEAEE